MFKVLQQLQIDLTHSKFDKTSKKLKMIKDTALNLIDDFCDDNDYDFLKQKFNSLLKDDFVDANTITNYPDNNNSAWTFFMPNDISNKEFVKIYFNTVSELINDLLVVLK